MNDWEKAEIGEMARDLGLTKAAIKEGLNMSTPGAKLQALRKREKVTCQVCDKSFIGLPVAKYCSDKCRQKAYRERRKG